MLNLNKNMIDQLNLGMILKKFYFLRNLIKKAIFKFCSFS